MPFISCICMSEEVADCRVSEMVRRVYDRQQPDIKVALETTADDALPPYPLERYIRVTHVLLLEGSVLTAPDPAWKSCDGEEEETIA